METRSHVVDEIEINNEVNEIIQALKNNAIFELDLSGFPLHYKNLKHIIQALKYNTSLTLLDLSNQVLQFSHIQYLVNVLKNNKTLTSLSLDNCQLHSDSEALKKLTKLFNYNHAITSLSLAGNYHRDSLLIEDDLKKLIACPSITHLNLENDFNPILKLHLFEEFKRANHLVEFCLGNYHEKYTNDINNHLIKNREAISKRINDATGIVIALIQGINQPTLFYTLPPDIIKAIFYYVFNDNKIFSFSSSKQSKRFFTGIENMINMNYQISLWVTSPHTHTPKPEKKDNHGPKKQRCICM